MKCQRRKLRRKGASKVYIIARHLIQTSIAQRSIAWLHDSSITRSYGREPVQFKRCSHAFVKSLCPVSVQSCRVNEHHACICHLCDMITGLRPTQNRLYGSTVVHLLQSLIEVLCRHELCKFVDGKSALSVPLNL